MSTKKAKGGTVYRTITQGKTQRATAEAIYEHLIAHPKDMPSAPSENLAFRLAGAGAACIQFSDYNGLNLSAWPGSTTEIQVERGWCANWGDRIGRGVLISNPHNPARGDRDESIRLIRIAIGRTLRYHQKERERVDASIARRETERRAEQAANAPIHLHVPADATGLNDAINALVEGGVPATVHRDGDSYFEWGEPLSADPGDDDTTHVVIEVPSENAAATYNSIAQAGILVDATLASDWSSRVTWGLGPEPDGWFRRYGHRISV